MDKRKRWLILGQSPLHHHYKKKIQTVQKFSMKGETQELTAQDLIPICLCYMSVTAAAKVICWHTVFVFGVSP